MSAKPTLPVDAKARKALPIITGVLDYFPDALAEVADLSRVGNDQHNPGQPLHWSKHKSSDHDDCIGRHLIDRGKRDSDNIRHRTKVAWRALASLQIEIEAERAGLSIPQYLEWLKEDAKKQGPTAPHGTVPGDWMPWRGSGVEGGKPVFSSPQTPVKVRWRDGTEHDGKAGDWAWNHDGEGNPGGYSDVMAYAVLAP